MASLHLWRLLSLYISSIAAVLRRASPALSRLIRCSIIVTLIESCLSLYFIFLGLSPTTVELDDHTTVHFWTSAHRRFSRPNLVLVHGFGGNSRWQFLQLVGPLSRSFNLYVPDLLFFGKSHTFRRNRSEGFQARCVVEGLRGLGVGRCRVFGISYGGYVAYRMAEMWPEVVERVAIASCGIGYTEEQKREHLGKLGRSVTEIFLPESPKNLRRLLNLSIYKFDPLKWAPDFFLQHLIDAMLKDYRKEKLELLEHLLAQKADPDIPIPPQETMLIWGDKDDVFPPLLAFQLQRHFGPKTKLEIIKDTGHALNIDSPARLYELIESFSLGCSNSKDDDI
ncbi:uncharacterized protein LOC100266896 [Vitis vinifera]|eukprot:XP_010654429.1 PREDICTED: uncharacterized protein LOC100266896 isoform X1 [Vitis vinifera]